MEGFVVFEALPAADVGLGFDAGFMAEFAPAEAETADDDSAWLFRQASLAQKADLRTVEGRGAPANIGERVRSLVRDLSQFGGDRERRATILAEVATLRQTCRHTDAWRSADYDWPLLSD